MNREILFRGKQCYIGEWVYGYLAEDGCGLPVIETARFMSAVEPDTIGQSTGLTDKNGKKIFEGDVVECVSRNVFVSVDGEPMKPFQRRMEIVFHKGAFCMKETYGGEMPPSHFDLRSGGRFSISGDLKVIGNIHDNPELMEGE